MTTPQEAAFATPRAWSRERSMIRAAIRRAVWRETQRERARIIEVNSWMPDEKRWLECLQCGSNHVGGSAGQERCLGCGGRAYTMVWRKRDGMTDIAPAFTTRTLGRASERQRWHSLPQRPAARERERLRPVRPDW